MTKYVIDLPEGTTSVVAKKRGLLGEIDVMRIPVDQLKKHVEHTVADDETVEKRVIELPADLFEKLTTEKENASNIYEFFDMDSHSLEIMNWLSEYLPAPDNLEPENIAGDWYLGHVEFVAEKEDHFVLAFPNKVTSSLDMRYLKLINNGYAINNIDAATRLTDADINELAEKFPEINFDGLEKVEVEQ